MPYLRQVLRICVSFQFAIEFLPFSCISEKGDFTRCETIFVVTGIVAVVSTLIAIVVFLFVLISDSNYILSLSPYISNLPNFINENSFIFCS